MPFIGNIINFFAVLVFSVIGSLVKVGLPEKINRALLHAVAICVVYVGVDGILEAAPAVPEGFFLSAGLTKFIIMILSLVIGTAIGEIIDIDKWVNRLGRRLEAKFSKDDESRRGNFAKGFVSCTIMTCVGAMAVNGSILDGLGNPDVIIAKSVIDAVSCFVMASSFGIGCAFAAIPMMIYQGGIAALSYFLSASIPAASVSYLSATGSLIIILLGTNFLSATNVKTANMTPSVFIPLLIAPIINLF